MRRLLIILISIIIVPIALSADSLFKAVTNEKYLALEFLPLCTSEGQTIFQLTNVSGQKLLVDPAFMDIDKFDANRFGIDLVNLTNVGDDPRLSSKASPEGQNNWYPMEAGEVVQHKIDFREYGESALDTSVVYLPAFNGMPIRMITTLDGQKVTLFRSVLDRTYANKFGPECWK